MRKRTLSASNAESAAKRLASSSRGNPFGASVIINEPETNLTLNCIIWGEYSSQVFKVNIERNKSIDSFRKAIKTKRPGMLQGIDNENISVHIAEDTIPIAIDSKDIEANRNFEDDVYRVLKGPVCRPSQKLSEIFKDKLDAQDLHVVLNVPHLTIPLCLFCIVQSEVTSFNVNVDRRSNVDELKEAIIKRLTESPTTWRPTIWGVSIPIDGFSEKIKEMDFNNQGLLPFERLTHLFPMQPDLDHVHIIVERGLLSESDLLKLCPPSLGYINVKKSAHSTISGYRRTPHLVVTWDRFNDDVNNATWDDVQKYSLPTFQEYQKISNEERVRDALYNNVFRILNIVLKQEEYDDHSSLKSVVGEPDFIQTGLNQVLRLAIEVKTKWVLWEDDLVTTYNQNLSKHQEETTSSISVYNQVKQIFGYLSHNSLRYGVLTTYDKTWFLFRPPDNPGQLRISPAIQSDDQQPTLFQCLLYITLLARANRKCDPPSPKQPHSPDCDPSPEDQDDVSSYKDEENSDSSHDNDEPKRKSGSAKARGRTPKRGQGHEAPIAGGRSRVKTRPSHPLNRDEKRLSLDFFDWDSFKVLDVLGYGRSGKVFKAVLHGEIVALKICDLWQHPDYKEELLNEVKVYRALEDLQGKCIPRLKSAGYTAGGLFAIATDIVGRPLEDRESLSTEERLAIQSALSSIHGRGFVHGDIRNENILIKRNGGEFSAYFIDFGFSKEGGRSDFGREKLTLGMLLGQL